MFAAFLKAFGQLADGATRRLIWLSLGAAIAVFAALWLTIGTALHNTELFASGWLETIVDVLGWAATLVLTHESALSLRIIQDHAREIESRNRT